MFFKTSDINVKILSLLELKWDKRNDLSDFRPYHALSFRVKGDAVFKDKRGSVSAKTGDVVFVPANYRYNLISESEHLFVVHFTSDTPLPEKIKKFTAQNSAYILSSFEKLYAAWQKKEQGYEYECKSYFYKIIAFIEKNYLSKKKHNYGDKIGDAIDYIHENYISETISVEYLAKLCNMSGTYLRKLFKQRFAQSPQEYVNKLKLQYATELLVSGYYSVSEVSDMCNFQNIHYFSSFIKKATGLTPSQIRSGELGKDSFH